MATVQTTGAKKTTTASTTSKPAKTRAPEKTVTHERRLAPGALHRLHLPQRHHRADAVVLQQPRQPVENSPHENRRERRLRDIHNDDPDDLGVFPIGIDPTRFVDALTTTNVMEHMDEFKRQFSGKHVVLGIDRFDYTKGIAQKLLALEHSSTNTRSSWER